MFGKPAVPMKSHVLLHGVGSVITALFMFIGVTPTCHRYELIAWRTIYFTTIYVQHDHRFGGHVLGYSDFYPLILRLKIYHGKAVPKSMLMIEFVCMRTAEELFLVNCNTIAIS